MTNAPDIDHQFAVMEITFQIKFFVTQNGRGYVLPGPFKVRLSEEIEPVQPDVIFISTKNWPGPGAKCFKGAPDLVIEVISPDTRRADQVIKFMTYELAKVPEYWIADPKTRFVQVFTLKEHEYVLLGEFSGREMIESEVLKGMKIVTDSLFIMKQDPENDTRKT